MNCIFHNTKNIIIIFFLFIIILVSPKTIFPQEKIKSEPILKNKIQPKNTQQNAQINISKVKAEQIFIKANSAYKNGLFIKAISHYQNLIHNGYGTGYIYFNLANSHYRNASLGKAILNYQRAKLFLPRDPDIAYNLSFCNQKKIDIIKKEGSLLSLLFFWQESLSLSESFLIFIIVNFILFLFLILKTFIKKETLYYSIIISLIIWSLYGFSFLWNFFQVNFDKSAVIIHKEVNVHSGPDQRETTLFKLHQGAMVQIHNLEGNWRLISVGEKKRGWLVKDQIEKIINKQLLSN